MKEDNDFRKDNTQCLWQIMFVKAAEHLTLEIAFTKLWSILMVLAWDMYVFMTIRIITMLVLMKTMSMISDLNQGDK